MLILPKDTWDLFSTWVPDATRGWVARFLGHGLLVLCSESFSDYYRRAGRDIHGRLARLALLHEAVHFEHAAGLLYTQAYYWSWLDLFAILNRTMAEADTADFKAIECGIGPYDLPPTPLDDDISINMLGRQLRYDSLLEGFAIVGSLHNSRFVDAGLRQAFLERALLHPAAKVENATHIQGYELVDEWFLRLSEHGLLPENAALFPLMNHWPLFQQDDFRTLHSFFSDKGATPGPERRMLCRKVYELGLNAFAGLFENSGLSVEMLGDETELNRRVYDLIIRKAGTFPRLTRRARHRLHEAEGKNYSSMASGGDSAFLTLTMHDVVFLLEIGLRCFLETPRFLRVYADMSLAPSPRLWFWPYCVYVFRDGTIVSSAALAKKRPALCSARNSYALGAAVRFVTAKEIVRWVAEGGALVCPFYGFFINSFGSAGFGGLRTFCGRCVGRGGEIEAVPSARRCCTDGSELDIAKLAQRERGLCLFWRNVLWMFRKFTKVRRGA